MHTPLLVALTLTSGCGLVADFGPRANDAGTAGFDAEPGLDAPGLDALGVDAAPGDDAESEHDAGPGPSDPCMGRPDGTMCSPPDGPRRICLAESCTPSSCGDGFVDVAAGEQCEPSTHTNCEPPFCRFDCVHDDDCGSSPCVEANCIDHHCVYTALDYDASCVGTCIGARCVEPSCGNGMMDVGEDCDPGALSVPGCVGCRFECETDADCDDGDPCTRNSCEEDDDGDSSTPSFPTCKAMTRTCSPPLSPCDVSICVGDDDCALVPAVDVDGDGVSGASDCPASSRDCDDLDPRVGAPADETCNGLDDDCDDRVDEGLSSPSAHCFDGDGDGYGDPARPMMVTCGAPPAGYVPDCTDCWDTAEPRQREIARQVHPRQTRFFDVPYCPTATMTSSCSFDYDCDGLERPGVTTRSRCRLLNLGRCATGAGWTEDPPRCGELGEWASCHFLGVCLPSPEERRQACN